MIGDHIVENAAAALRVGTGDSVRFPAQLTASDFVAGLLVRGNAAAALRLAQKKRLALNLHQSHKSTSR